MNKEEVVQLMLDTFQEINYLMATGSGMDLEEIKKQMEQSEGSIRYMLTACYDKLEQNDLLKK